MNNSIERVKNTNIYSSRNVFSVPSLLVPLKDLENQFKEINPKKIASICNKSNLNNYMKETRSLLGGISSENSNVGIEEISFIDFVRLYPASLHEEILGFSFKSVLVPNEDFAMYFNPSLIQENIKYITEIELNRVLTHFDPPNFVKRHYDITFTGSLDEVKFLESRIKNKWLHASFEDYDQHFGFRLDSLILDLERFYFTVNRTKRRRLNGYR